MATATLLQPLSRRTPPFPVYRLTVKQYHSMIEAGILTENDRVELLEGWLVPKMTHNPPHDCAIQLVQKEFARLLPGEFLLRIQSAITVSAESEPEPDLAVVRGPIRRYARTHPRPRDIALLVEVAEATLPEDRIKCESYARARIPVYWIVNLVHSRLEVYSEPRAGKVADYRVRHDYSGKDHVPFVLEGRQLARIAVRDLLP